MTEAGAASHQAGRRFADAATIAAFLAAAFAGWAAWETRMSVLETARATRAQVLLQLATEWGSKEIFTSLQTLRKWAKEQQPLSPRIAFKALFLKENKSDTEASTYRDVAVSLERVTDFFEKLQLISEQELIDKKLLPSILPCSTYHDIIAKVLIPMTLARVDGQVETKELSASAKADAQEATTSQGAFYRRVLCPGEK
jgi:hypothetical protein